MKESNVLISQAEMSDTKVQASIHARHSISRGTIRGLPLSLLKTDDPKSCYEAKVYRRNFKRNARELLYLLIAYIHSYGISRT